MSRHNEDTNLVTWSLLQGPLFNFSCNICVMLKGWATQPLKTVAEKVIKSRHINHQLWWQWVVIDASVICLSVCSSGPPGEYNWTSASLGPHESTIPKRQIDRFSRFWTAHDRRTLYVPPKLPLPIGICQLAIFRTDDRRMSLYFTMVRPFPLKIAPSHAWGSELPSNTRFLGPTWVLNPNGNSIASAVFFAGLTSVTDRQTDRPYYSVGNNRPHLRK